MFFAMPHTQSLVFLLWTGIRANVKLGPLAGDASCILNVDNLNGSEALAMLHLHSSARIYPSADALPPFLQELQR